MHSPWARPLDRPSLRPHPQISSMALSPHPRPCALLRSNQANTPSPACAYLCENTAFRPFRMLERLPFACSGNPGFPDRETPPTVPLREGGRDWTPAPCAGRRPIFARKARYRRAKSYHRQAARPGKRQRSVVRLARSESRPPKHPATCAPPDDTQSRSAQVL